MKKVCSVLFLAVALIVSLSTYAQDSKKEATPKAKTEQVEKKSEGKEGKACCAKKDKACCKKGKEAKACPKEAGAETKSCGKKK